MFKKILALSMVKRPNQSVSLNNPYKFLKN